MAASAADRLAARFEEVHPAMRKLACLFPKGEIETFQIDGESFTITFAFTGPTKKNKRVANFRNDKISTKIRVAQTVKGTFEGLKIAFSEGIEVKIGFAWPDVNGFTATREDYNDGLRDGDEGDDAKVAILHVKRMPNIMLSNKTVRLTEAVFSSE